MKKADVTVGAVYAARVSGRIVPIRVDAEAASGGYYATSLATHKMIRVRSAARFRWRVCEPCSAALSLSTRPARFRRKSTGEAVCREHATKLAVVAEQHPLPVEALSVDDRGADE